MDTTIFGNSSLARNDTRSRLLDYLSVSYDYCFKYEFEAILIISYQNTIASKNVFRSLYSGSALVLDVRFEALNREQ